MQKRVKELERAMGLITCYTLRRSQESNGMAEAFFGSFMRLPAGYDLATSESWITGRGAPALE